MNTFNIPFAERTVQWAMACLLAVAQTMGQSYDWKWSYALNSPEPEHFHAVAADSTEGSILVVGDAQNTSLIPTLPTLSNRDQAVVYKFDSWGSVRWRASIIGSDEATPEHIAIGPDGTVFITGVYTATCHFTSANGTISTAQLVASDGSKDIYLAAFSPNGAFLWARSIGNQYDEGHPDLAVDNTGIVLTGTFISTNTAVGGTTQASIFLDRYDLDGDPIWSVIGGTMNDDQPTTIDSDGERIYLGAIAGGNALRWYHTGTGQWNITNQTESDHVISAFLMDGSWAWSMSINDPSNNAVGRPNLVATCGAVFVTGAVGSGSTFPNASPITSGNASAYLMRLQAHSGVVDFVRTGYGTSGGARFNPRDISIGKRGLIHIGGTFEGTVNFGASIISATHGADAFVMTAGDDGTLKQLTAITGHDDQILSGIAADRYGGVIVSGAFEDEIAIPAHPLSGSTSDRHAFVAFAQFGDRAADPHNPAFFTLPNALCIGASIDLNERLIASATGSGIAVVTSTSATAITNALGPWDNAYTTLQGGGGSITLAFVDTLPADEALHIRWRATSAGMSLPTLRIETSVDGANWTLGTATSSRTEAVISQWVLAAPTRYVRLTAPTSGTILDIDGVIHTTGSIPGGTWSGTGVSGSNFTPTASGSSAITYTVPGACPSIHSATVTVTTPPDSGTLTVAHDVVPCPNQNQGTITLSHSFPAILRWEWSTDAFLTAHPIPNTDTVLGFTNLSETRSYRAVLDGGVCGQHYSAMATISIVDTVAPAILGCPSDISMVTDTTCTSLVTWTEPSTTDQCGIASIIQTNGPSNGDDFPIGTTTVRYTATDPAGNSSTCSFSVNIIPLDTDADGVADCMDPCPLLANVQPGQPCDDGDPTTVNDRYGSDCTCTGEPTDCAGVVNGTAAIDACGNCTGGTTGITPNAACTDCAGVVNGTAAIDACGNCTGGTTGITPNAACTDCAGVVNGTAAIDACGNCTGGTTGITPNAACTDCAGVVNGTAAIDACGNCTGGTTGITPNAACTDCAGVVNGTSLPGTACNDNDPTTVNDTWNTSCECVGVMEACSSDAGPDQTVCAPYATLAALGTGQWSGPAGILFHDPGSPTTTIEIASPGTYLLSWMVTQGTCTATDTLRLTWMDQVDLVEVSAGDDQYLEVTQATTLMAVATPGADLTWNLISGTGMIEAPAAQQTMVHGLGAGTNTFQVTATLWPCGSASDTVRIIVKDLFIPQGFSPNGDGENDRFEITGMMAFPDSRFTVYNRWGQLVYENMAYANEWDGRSGSGQDLPDATYFYVLNLSGDRSYNGFIVIKR